MTRPANTPPSRPCAFGDGRHEPKTALTQQIKATARRLFEEGYQPDRLQLTAANYWTLSRAAWNITLPHADTGLVFWVCDYGGLRIESGPVDRIGASRPDRKRRRWFPLEAPTP